MTERELIDLQREAFIKGSCWRWQQEHPRGTNGVTNAERRAAADAYPYPAVPRVVKDPDPDYSQEWRCWEGEIQFKAAGSGPWTSLLPHLRAGRAYGCTEPTAARIRLWADLLENPNEPTQ